MLVLSTRVGLPTKKSTKTQCQRIQEATQMQTMPAFSIKMGCIRRSDRRIQRRILQVHSSRRPMDGSLIGAPRIGASTYVAWSQTRSHHIQLRILLDYDSGLRKEKLSSWTVATRKGARRSFACYPFQTNKPNELENRATYQITYNDNLYNI